MERITGCAPHFDSGADNTLENITIRGAHLYFVEAINPNAADCFLQLFDTAYTSLRTSGYRWVASGNGTNEYYLTNAAGGDPSLGSEPDDVRESTLSMTAGTAGSLSAGEWDYADNDTLGYSTIYVRLSDPFSKGHGADPDSYAAGYVDASFIVIGTTTPVLSLLIPGGDGTYNGAMEHSWPHEPLDFDEALKYTVTTTATGSGKPTSDLTINAAYKPTA